MSKELQETDDSNRLLSAPFVSEPSGTAFLLLKKLPSADWKHLNLGLTRRLETFEFGVELKCDELLMETSLAQRESNVELMGIRTRVPTSALLVK